MSYQAIYEVTRALRMLLQSSLSSLVPNAEVTLLPPGDALPDSSGINLFLYRVLESPFTRNRDWPGDRVTAPAREPALGLQLYYLMTPLGARPADANPRAGDDAHTMLGQAMLTLHEFPVLNDIHTGFFDSDVVLPAFLLDSYEKIKVCLAPVGLDELSKIWSTINRPYRLSVAYEVSLVELVSSVPPLLNGGIVTLTNLDVRSFDPPEVAQLEPDQGSLGSTSSGAVVPNRLTLHGFRLLAPRASGAPPLELPVVRVGGVEAVLDNSQPQTENVLTVILPVDVNGGPFTDVVVSLSGRQSAPATFTVTPWLTRLKPLRMAPDPAAPSAASMLMSGLGFSSAGVNPFSVRLEWLDQPGVPPVVRELVNFLPPMSPPSTDVEVEIPVDLPNGLYSVRLVLDDAVRSASNPRSLEIVPWLQDPLSNDLLSVVLATGPGHQLTLRGARLAGQDVRLIVDGVPHQVRPSATGVASITSPPQNLAGEPNAQSVTATEIVFTFARQLVPGVHTVAVAVDGHTSRTVQLLVTAA